MIMIMLDLLIRGFDITSLPNPYTQFNFLDFKLAIFPYMKFKFNTDSNVYQITDANANYHKWFSCHWQVGFKIKIM